MRGTLITARVVLKIELVIRFSVPPLTRWNDLCDNLAAPPLLVGALCDILRNGLLLRRVEEDGAAVLGACVGALVVELRRVVDGVEVLDQLPVRQLLRVEGDLQRFGVCGNPTSALRATALVAPSALRPGIRTSGVASAHLPVARVRGVATNVSDLCVDEALVREALAVCVLDAPEAARRDCSLLVAAVGDAGRTVLDRAQRAGGEWAHEAREETAHGGHCRRSDQRGDNENEDGEGECAIQGDCCRSIRQRRM